MERTVKEGLSFKPPKFIRNISLKPPKVVRDTVKKIGAGAADLAVVATLDPVVIPLIETYRGTLWAQAHWKRLPPALVEKAQQFFKTDLKTVTYAENINTGHGMAITFDRTIYFPRTVNLRDRANLLWLLHELTHVDQYNKAGWRPVFYHKYVKQIADKVLKNRRFNVHDLLELERAADTHAAQIVDQIHQKW